MSPTKHEDETAKDAIREDFLKELGITPEEQKGMVDAAYSGAADDIAAHAGLGNKAIQELESEADSDGTTSKADEDESNRIPFNEEEDNDSRDGPFSRARRRVRNLSGRAKAGIGVGVTTGGIGIMSLLGIGSFQAIHLLQSLMPDFTPSEESSDVRMNALYRYARSGGNFAETRVSLLGSRKFRASQADLEKIGVTLDNNKGFGVNKGLVIEADKFPVTKGLPRERIPGAIEAYFNKEKLRVNTSNIKIEGNRVTIGGTAGKNLSIAVRRALVNDSIAQLDGGRVSKWLKARSLKKAYNLPSIFHPFKRADAKITEKLASWDDYRKARKAQREGNIRDPSKAAEAYDKLKSKTTGFRAGASAALLITAGTCLARDAAGEAITYNREAIALPQALDAADAIAVGAQQMSGQDFAPEQLDIFNKLMQDEDGKTIWNAKALQAKTNPDGAEGEDLPEEYVQAFSIDGTASTLANAGGAAGRLACSDAGQIGQVALGVVLAALAIPTGGTSEVVYGGVRLAAGAAGGAVAMIALHNLLSSALKDEPIPDDVSATVRGNLLAYGSRELANTTARTSGGIQLSDAESAMLDRRAAQQSNVEFESKSFFAKMFDAKDYRSVAGKAIDSYSSPKQEVQNVAQGFLNIGPMFASMFGKLNSSAQAATTYDYGFPRYGIPQRLLNNPDYEDPYENADKVAALLDSDQGQDYIDRAKKCFGVTVSKDSGAWGVEPAEGDVNPYSEEYEEGNCAEENNSNWDRMILFVSDSLDMEAAACYLGEEDSCTIIGADTPETDGESDGFGMRVASFNILHAPDGNVPERLSKSVKTLLHPPDGGAPVDVAGLQEVRPEQLTMLKNNNYPGDDKLNDYDMFPDTTQHPQYQPNVIIWRKDKYTALSKEFVDARYFHGEEEQFPVIKFKDNASGKMFYFMNIHSPRSGNGRGENAPIRDDNARRFQEYFADLKQREPDTAMVLVGDFNAGYQAPGPNGTLDDVDVGRRAFCILTNGVFWDAWHASKNIDGKCPSNSGVSYVDHIFVDRDTNVSKYFIARLGQNNNGSDHNTIFANVGVGLTSTNYKNPVYSGVGQGPTVVRGDDGTFHVYLTSDDQHPFKHLKSKDLVHWNEVPRETISNLSSIPSELRNVMWAPDVAKTGDHYTLVFTGGSERGSSGSRYIGYATSDDAGGPFTYRGRITEPINPGGRVLDPHLFIDGNKTYITYGSSPISISEVSINSDGTMQRRGEEKVLVERGSWAGHPSTIEQSWLEKINGKYYMFYSAGHFENKSGPQEYSVRVARSDNLMGPYAPQNHSKVVIQGKDPFRAPGVSTLIQDDSGAYWMLYNAFKGSDRRLMLDKLNFEDGWPVANDGSPSSTQQTGPLIATGEDGKGKTGSIKMGDDYARGCEQLRANGGGGLACDNQCVDFVKFRLKKHINKTKFASLGNGQVVAANLGLVYGYKVNHTPAVNSVVSWRAGQFGASSSAGHTAMVSKVNSDGSIVVEEYNWVSGEYGTRKLSAEQARQLTYAHTEVDF